MIPDILATLATLAPPPGRPPSAPSIEGSQHDANGLNLSIGQPNHRTCRVHQVLRRPSLDENTRIVHVANGEITGRWGMLGVLLG